LPPTSGTSDGGSPAGRPGRRLTLLVAAALAHTFVNRHADNGGRAGWPFRRRYFCHLDIRLACWPLAYLYTEMTTDERAMGTFILPILVALAGDSRLHAGERRYRAAVLRGPLFSLHVSSLLAAYASFALACVESASPTCLLFKEIKAKHLGFLLRAAALPAGCSTR